MKAPNKARITFIIVLWAATASLLFPGSLTRSFFTDTASCSSREAEFPENRHGQKAKEFWEAFFPKDLAKLEKFFAARKD